MKNCAVDDCQQSILNDEIARLRADKADLEQAHLEELGARDLQIARLRVDYEDAEEARNDAENRLLKALDERDVLLASCKEFLPILERGLVSVNPGGIADASKAFQCAAARVDRMRTAIARATEGK
jgi:hypothetical protein